jgi:DNA-directed RNA polymerase specialized sigma24 family protein
VQDVSFTEFVVARWSTLYRLAVLLAGPEDADDLAQEALVRAYLAWPDIEEHAADDQVKSILAATAAARPRVAEPGTDDSHQPAGSRTDRQGLDAEFGRLPPRQRTVLVLRHYEMLSDAEIAHTLGCSVETVTAETPVVEARVDPAELGDELVRRAGEAVVPLPPVAAVLARGHEARRRRTRRGLAWSAGVAAFVVVGLALANLVQAGTSDRPPRATPTIEVPRDLAALPTGERPRIAYAVRRLLHVNGGDVVVLPGKPETIVQTSHWLFVAYRSGGIVRIDPDTMKATTVQAVSGGQLVTDPSGDHIAWLDGGTGSTAVVVQSVDSTGLVSDVQNFPVGPHCCDNPFLVDGITPDGSVIASLPAESRAWVWTTPDGGESEVREISGIGNGVVTKVTAGGIVVQYGSSHFALGDLQGDAFFVRDEINARVADFGDPSGDRVVFTDTNGEVHARKRPFSAASLRDGQDVRLELPVLAESFASARWEDDRHVLLDLSDVSMPDGALVRCDVVSGRCEIAARLDGPHLLAD